MGRHRRSGRAFFHRGRNSILFSKKTNEKAGIFRFFVILREVDKQFTFHNMRSATALMLNADEPILRFEESSHRSPVVSSLQSNPATSESQGNDPYSSLKRKQEELLKIRQQL